MGNNFELPVEQVQLIQKILDELLDKTKSTYVFLADISGQLIQVRGRAGVTESGLSIALP
jgi:hypothetical protein